MNDIYTGLIPLKLKLNLTNKLNVFITQFFRESFNLIYLINLLMYGLILCRNNLKHENKYSTLFYKVVNLQFGCQFSDFSSFCFSKKII